MSHRTLLGIGALSAALAVTFAGTGAALAQPAKAKAVKPFVNNLIVTQKSIGGFAIGEAPASVRKHFPKKDCTHYGCLYTGSGYNATVNFGAKAGSTKSTVNFLSLTTTTGKDGAAKVRTSTGVGLGSTYAKAKKGLKHARYSGTSKSGYFYIGKGTIGSVDTTVYITNGVVNLINVQRVDHAG